MTTNTTMTIKQAIERVEKLESNMERCSSLLFMLKRDAARFKGGCYVAATDYNGHGATLSLQSLLDTLEAQKLADKAETEKLRPVIDMANAALKGVLS